MEKKCLCSCSSGEKIVMSCSGASDLGQFSDLIARKLHQKGRRKMNCLAVVGAGNKRSIENFKQKQLLLIDGCAQDCGKTILESEGFNCFSHFRLTDFGYQKGKTTVSEETIDDIIKKIDL
jgi:uncharacterized metal-binding protein